MPATNRPGMHPYTIVAASVEDVYAAGLIGLLDEDIRSRYPGEPVNGIDPAQSAGPRALPPGGRRARFGYFGQISEFKGLHILLDAIGRVSEKAWGDDAALSRLVRAYLSMRHRDSIVGGIPRMTVPEPLSEPSASWK